MAARPLFSPRRSLLLAIGVVIDYALLVGAGASVVRAAIVSSLALIGGRLGWRRWGLNTLATSALLMTLQNPSVLWDIGFQLTAAVLGILLYGDRLDTGLDTLLLGMMLARHPASAGPQPVLAAVTQAYRTRAYLAHGAGVKSQVT